MARKLDYMNMKLGAVIAEREYWLATKGRKRKTVHVRFGKPRKDPAGNDYHLADGMPAALLERYATLASG